jgi:hypothetical protein
MSHPPPAIRRECRRSHPVAVTTMRRTPHDQRAGAEWPHLLRVFLPRTTSVREPVEESSRLISLDNRLFCAANGQVAPALDTPQITPTSQLRSSSRRPVTGRVTSSMKLRHFRCEVRVARKPYTEDPALLRQPQGTFGSPMSASAHFVILVADSDS